ncbi:MAG: DnaA regulatory inactivator Hda, partial [Betaproteobacteria bacterium HGW-Betaproteobacteria-13]
VGANSELVASLSLLATDRSLLPAPHLYLWGTSGKGRSHLLQAAVAVAAANGRQTHYLSADTVRDALPETPDALLAIDDIDRLRPEAQIALFNAFNRARLNGQSLLLAGLQPPLALALREDLRTRIGQSLIFEVQPLDDDSRAAILATLAERRGLRLGDDVVDFLMRHGRRDLPSLLAAFNALDAASLEQKRPITLPLLREMMQQGLAI